MAKVSFNKLGFKINTDIKIITVADQEIEVKQYLPIEDKLALISNVLNAAADENNFSNPVKLEIFGALEILYNYTNINFTDKQKENPAKLYDILESNKIIDTIVSIIPQEEYKTVVNAINECSEAVYTYRNSAMGIMESIATDYSQLDFDASKIQQNLADPNNMALLKDVLTKLG